jgi:hypothetical protein
LVDNDRGFLLDRSRADGLTVTEDVEKVLGVGGHVYKELVCDGCLSKGVGWMISQKTKRRIT